MIANKKLIFPIIVSLLISLIGNTLQVDVEKEHLNLSIKTNFYNKVLRSQQDNDNIELITKNNELYLSAKTDIAESSNIITLNSKFHFTGCN